MAPRRYRAAQRVEEALGARGDPFLREIRPPDSPPAGYPFDIPDAPALTLRYLLTDDEDEEG